MKGQLATKLFFALLSCLMAAGADPNEKSSNSLRNKRTQGMASTGRELKSMEFDNLIKAGINIDDVNFIFQPVAVTFINSIISDLSGSIEIEEVSTGSCCEVGDTGGNLSAALKGFFLIPPREEDITLKMKPGVNASNSIQAEINAERIEAGFSEIDLAPVFSASTPFDNCTVSANVSAVIQSVSFNISITQSPTTRKFTISTKNLRSDGLDFSVQPIYDFNICEPVNATITTLFDSLEDEMKSRVQSSVDDLLVNTSLVQLPNVEYEVPLSLPINLNKNNILNIEPRIEYFSLSQDEKTLWVEGTSNTEAVLSFPEWRDGYKFNRKKSSEYNVRDPTGDNLVNFNIGLDTVNDVVAKLYYVLWAGFVFDESTSTSPLCESTTNDPCLLPPYRANLEKNGDQIYQILSSFLSNSSLDVDAIFSIISFWFSGFYADAVVQTPTFNIINDEMWTGSAAVTFSVFGINLIAEFDTNIHMNMTSLKYDPVTQTFSGLEVSSLDLDALSLTYLRWSNFDSLWFAFYGFAESTIKNQLIQFAFPKAYEQSLKVAPFLTEKANRIPTVPDFLSQGYSLKPRLGDVVISGIPSTADVEGYVSIGGEFSIEILP